MRLKGAGNPTNRYSNPATRAVLLVGCMTLFLFAIAKRPLNPHGCRLPMQLHCSLLSPVGGPKPQRARARCRNRSRSSGVMLAQRSSMRRRTLERAVRFNGWIINGKSFPDTDPLLVHQRKRYRMIFRNESGDTHPLHLHRHSFSQVRIAEVSTTPRGLSQKVGAGSFAIV